VRLDPTTRLSLLSQLEKQSGGKLEMFFASYGLGAEYAAPGKNWGKAKHIAAAMTAADRQGEGDAILLAAAAYFGLAADEANTPVHDDANIDDEPASKVKHAAEQQPASPAQSTATDPASPGSSPADDLRRLAFQAWDMTGEWPLARVLQRRIERDRGRLDVDQAGRALDPTIGFLEQKHDGRVVLKVGGLIGISGADRYLSVFVSTIQLAYRTYVDAETDESPVLSDQMVREHLSLDGDMVWRLYSLLDGESFLLEGGGSSPEERTFRRHISPQIRFFRDVADINDYARTRDELLRPYRDPAPTGSPDSHNLNRMFPGSASAAGERGSQVFNTVIFGGSAAIGPNASVLVKVVPGDLSSLMGFLAQQGLGEDDRNALAEAIRSDEQSGDDERPGSRVRDWFGRMTFKVASSGARVGEQTTAALIAAAIAKYLGLL
jgi:hypothetical protein